MSRSLSIPVPLAVVALALLSFGEADAFPGFARKYSPTSSVFTFMPCASCHDTYPKLTPFGRRFKENGFRVDGDTGSWKESLQAYPVAVRMTSFSTGLGSPSGGSTFGVVKPIAAGSLGRTLSFWIDQSFRIDGDGLDRRDLNFAWVGAHDVLRDFRSDLLSLRAGAFELDLPFTQARTHNLFSYEPYFLAGQDPEWSLAAPQRGVELSGRPFPAARYSVALVESVRRSTERDGYRGDVYARFALDAGAAHRVGAFWYDGSDDLLGEGGTTRVEHRRAGADFDLRFASAGASLHGLYLWGEDRGSGETASQSGGFVQAEKLAVHWLLLTSRYTFLRPTQSGSREIRQSLALGSQAWFFERLRIAFEYRFQKGSRPNEGVLSIDFVL